jgi:hypothetical protein
MFQFGEVLTLAISLVVVIFLATAWRRIRAAPLVRPFVLPVLLITGAWVFTVLEGIGQAPPGQPVLLFYGEDIFPATRTWWFTICNGLEHLLLMAGAMALLAAVYRAAFRKEARA